MQNPSNILSFFISKQVIRRVSAVGTVAIASLGVGCKEEGIQSYRVPTETYTATSPTAPVVSWAAPGGWLETASSSSMRYASFVIKGLHGHDVDVSITPLPAMRGGELENVNRWRGQVGLDPLAAEELDKEAEEVSIGEYEGRMFDMTSEEAVIHGEHHQRILAATLTKPATVWFFKMMGVAETVGEQKQVFQEFLESISIREPEIPAMTLPMMSGMGSPHGGGSSAPAAPSQAQPDWEIPEGWSPAAGSSMRIATFNVSGDESASAEIAVTKFPGTVGTLHGNIDRWRGQVGLGPIQPDQVGRYSRKLEWDGVDATLVDTSGVQEGERDPATRRLITIMVNKDGHMWFFKMSGDRDLVGQQEENLIQFAKSAQ